MITLIVILVFVSILLGMLISIKAFGTGSKRAKVFENIYFSFEDVNEIGVVYTKKGDYSTILRMDNPVRKYSADTDGYYEFTSMLASILQVLGEGYAIHKQDVFVRKNFNISSIAEKNTDERKRFLSDAYFKFFNGRPYVESQTYLTITQRGRTGGLKTYDADKWRDFQVKIQKVHDRLKSENISCRFLRSDECQEYTERFFSVDFKNEVVSMSDFKVESEKIGMGDDQLKVYSLLDVDDPGLPSTLRPYADISVNNSVMPQDLLSDLSTLPDVETIIYNQIIFLPNQKREIMKLEKKKNRHASIPNPNNQIAVEDINSVLNEVARNGKQFVYAHYNLVVKTSASRNLQKITNSLENLLARYSMHLSKRAYNQLELFVASFPGNCYELNPDYDRFLTLSDPALCLMYKEYQQKGDDTNLKCYYTDRQGVPMAVDVSGKEGKVRYTDNSNFFVLGPSGSGKSFFMNTVMRQYYEQGTDIVIVDTGDSYEGLCSYFEGIYITYSKEHPISMNPFKIERAEYEQNFQAKKDFLRNIIFLIFKGNGEPTKLEETIINQTLIEYFEEYFTPFEGFTKEQRDTMRRVMELEDKRTGKYEQYEQEMEERYGVPDDMDSMVSTDGLAKDNEEIPEAIRKENARNLRLRDKLQAVIDDSAATEGEKSNARNQLLRRLTPEMVESKYLEHINRKIDKIEQQRKKMRVTELSFNSYYEFAIERIPQIMRQDNVIFAINDFAAILKPFYKGGELEYTLNNDMDNSLFNEKFIVFEIDKIKENPVLFPIVVLIIMDVFTQKMLLKEGRKCLVIEEAWKAIATPVMATYIQYLYKTARKHWAMVGVVTQEIQDVTESKIVKEAIINNSGVFMLLDQSKFKDKFDNIKKTLALTDIDCKKIFTINRLENKEGRSPFKEVFIKRGQEGDVYGIEEPPECYMSYTTEKIEKLALKLYKKLLRCDHQHAIEAFVRDWKDSGIKSSLEFARKVLKERKVLNN
uniref:TraG P-loop domain-containing protein n=1 Tax=Prevotella sp. GTC17254 TaxID=3236794 RepID=A0AB33J2D8_9BACT